MISVHSKSWHFHLPFVVVFTILMGMLLAVDTTHYILPTILVTVVVTVGLLSIPIDQVLALIVLTVFIDVSPVSIAGSFIRITQFIFIAYFLKYSAIQAINRQFNSNVQLLRVLLFWLASLFLAWPHIISQQDFYVIILGQSYLYLLYFISYKHFASLDIVKQEEILKLYLIGGALIALIGIIQFPLLLLGLIEGMDRGIGLQSPSSLMREPDWYGLVTMYCGLFLLVLIVKKRELLNAQITRLFFIFCLSGMILSLTRAAWVGFLVGVLLLFITLEKALKKRLVRYFVIISMLLIIGFLIFGQIYPRESSILLNRINPLVSTHTDNGASGSRIASIQIMSHYIIEHPWVGNGAGGMGKISSSSDILSSLGINYSINAGRGNANLIVSSLFDSGIIGTIFLMSFLAMYLILLYKTYRKTKDAIVLGFLIAFMGILIDFMFNNGIRLSFVWLNFGLSLGYIFKLKEEFEFNSHEEEEG